MEASSELVFVLVASLALSVLLVAVAWRQRAAGIKGSDPLANVAFDLQESWLSTFTGLIAILGTISLTGFVVVSSGTGSGSSFTILSLFFVLLVAAGPLAYRASGTVGGYLVAAAAALWAAFGVIFSLGLFLVSISQQVEGGLTGFDGSSATVPGLATLLMILVIVILLPMIASYAHGKLTTIMGSRKALSGGVNFL